jgi:hypothetical protein
MREVISRGVRGLAFGMGALVMTSGMASATVTESGSAPIAVTTLNNDFTAFAELGNWFATSFTSGNFDGLISGSAIPANLNTTCGCSFGTGAANYIFNFTGTTGTAIATLFGSNTGWTGGINYELSSIAGNSYTFSLLSYVVSNGTSHLVTDFTGQLPTRTISVAVPGPVAGAGLPAVLGLMGFGLWRRRAASAA